MGINYDEELPRVREYTYPSVKIFHSKGCLCDVAHEDTIIDEKEKARAGRSCSIITDRRLQYDSTIDTRIKTF